jgi:hypothetical protein
VPPGISVDFKRKACNIGYQLHALAIHPPSKSNLAIHGTRRKIQQPVNWVAKESDRSTIGIWPWDTSNSDSILFIAGFSLGNTQAPHFSQENEEKNFPTFRRGSPVSRQDRYLRSNGHSPGRLENSSRYTIEVGIIHLTCGGPNQDHRGPLGFVIH